MIKRRIAAMDSVRGIAVCMMVAHHLLYDCVMLLGAPAWLYRNPVFDVLHYFFSIVFISVSGIASQFSRSNLKRGAILCVIAVLMSVVTGLIGMQIRFGVLHLLGFCIVFYALTRRIWDTIPKKLAPILYIALAILTAALTRIRVKAKFLWMFGFMYDGFHSADYFPIFPWLFVFLLGTWMGYYVKRGYLPRSLYRTKPGFFAAVGRRSLLIYLAHQPVLYGIVYLLSLL